MNPEIQTAQTFLEQEQYENAILQAAEILNEAPKNIAALLIRGKAEYYFSFQQENEDEAKAFMEKAFSSLSKTISLDQHNADALLFRAYIAFNYLNDKNDCLLADAESIMQLQDQKQVHEGLKYKGVALVRLGKKEESIVHFIEAIGRTKGAWANNFPQRDTYLSELYTFLGDLYLENENTVSQAFECYQRANACYPYNHENNLDTAARAFEYKQYDLAGKVAQNYHAFSHYEGQLDEGALAQKMYDFLQQGNKNQAIAEAAVFAIYRNDIEPFEEQLDFFNFIKELQEAYPNSGFLLGMMANVLYDNHDYTSALNYYEKALQFEDVTANYYAKWMISYCKIHQKVPMEKPPLKTMAAIDLFSSGVYLDEYQKQLTDKELSGFLLNEIVELYTKSYSIYNQYWQHQQGDGKSNNQHWFAMCCNNYGICLGQKNKFAEAVPIHKQGFELSPFWAQLNSLNEALYFTEQWPELLYYGELLYYHYSNDVSVYFHVLNIKYLCEAYAKTKQLEKLNAMVVYCNQNKLQWIDGIRENEPATHVKDVEDALMIINNTAINASAGEKDGATVLKEIENQLAEDPDNQQTLFYLFQQYHVYKEYQKCVDCANYYLKVKETTETPFYEGTEATFFYRRGASYRQLKQYNRAIDDLQNALKINEGKEDYWTTHELALAYLYSNDLHNAETFAWYCIDKYIAESFEFDDAINELASLLLEKYHTNNDEINALKVCDYLLRNDASHELAKSMGNL